MANTTNYNPTEDPVIAWEEEEDTWMNMMSKDDDLCAAQEDESVQMEPQMQRGMYYQREDCVLDLPAPDDDSVQMEPNSQAPNAEGCVLPEGGLESILTNTEEDLMMMIDDDVDLSAAHDNDSVQMEPINPAPSAGVCITRRRIGYETY